MALLFTTPTIGELRARLTHEGVVTIFNNPELAEDFWTDTERFRRAGWKIIRTRERVNGKIVDIFVFNELWEETDSQAELPRANFYDEVFGKKELTQDEVDEILWVVFGKDALSWKREEVCKRIRNIILSQYS